MQAMEKERRHDCEGVETENKLSHCSRSCKLIGGLCELC